MVARHDLTTDPQLKAALLTARRGTAFFGRKLNELADAGLGQPSLLNGWTRAHVVAHVGYNARAIARLTQWAMTGVETPMYSSAEERSQEIDLGATLPPTALRHLYDHSAIHLNVQWRDMDARAWDHEVKTAQGRIVRASETVWMRTREVWMHAVDLDNGASFGQIPADVLARLLSDITGAWAARGQGQEFRLCDTLSGAFYGASDSGTIQLIAGPLPQLVAWAAGRPWSGLQTESGAVISPAPRWI